MSKTLLTWVIIGYKQQKITNSINLFHLISYYINCEKSKCDGISSLVFIFQNAKYPVYNYGNQKTIPDKAILLSSDT